MADTFASIWRQQQRRVDTLVDQHFSEPIIMYPWQDGQHATGTGTPDATRTVLYSNACYVVPGAHGTGEGGTKAAGLTTKIQTSDEWISITEDALGGAAYWRQYDRVFLKERPVGEQWHSIEEIIPSALGRFDIHLIRLQE
jgi:hypothetical protein